MSLPYTVRQAERASLIGQYSSRLGDNILRQRANAALKAGKIEAEMASRAKSEFIANMSHELRTPLNAIVGFAGMLASGQGREPEKVSEYAGLIHGAAEHLQAVINGILDISSIQIGGLKIERRPFRLDGVIEQTRQLIAGPAALKKITLRYDVAGGLDLVDGDPLRIKQVLVNLVSNAVKFTEPGGAVALRAGKGHGNAIEIRISDTGIGMSADEIKLALQPFGQVHDGFDKAYGGTGLGLPLARALVELHGGDLRIDSRKGQGTSVTMALPAAVPPPAGAEA